jgi:hypothetical protein
MDEFFIILTGPLFVVWISLFYVIAKLIIRHMIHQLIGHSDDTWIIIAWTFVDISVLTLSLCLGCDVPLRYNLNPNASKLWYATLGLCIFMSALFYGSFVKRRNNMGKIGPFRDVRLFFYLSFTWLFGFAFFLPSLNALKL